LASVGLVRFMRVFRFLRIIRLLRLLRIRKLQALNNLVQERIDSEYAMIIVNLLRNIGGLIALNHFLACFWYWLGSVNLNGYSSTVIPPGVFTIKSISSTGIIAT